MGYYMGDLRPKYVDPKPREWVILLGLFLLVIQSILRNFELTVRQTKKCGKRIFYRYEVHVGNISYFHAKQVNYLDNGASYFQNRKTRVNYNK